MSIVHLRRNDPTVDTIVRSAFPDYNGRDIRAEISPTVRFCGTQWDEGSKRDYRIVRLADMQCVDVPDAPFLDHSRLHSTDHAIPDGFVVVVHDRWGLREHISIITPSGNVSALLPPPVELSEDEKTVLIATRSYKSSYAGIKDYRFSEAKSYTGITRDRWDGAKQALISRGLLDKRGALTTEGKNAIGMERF